MEKLKGIATAGREGRHREEMKIRLLDDSSLSFEEEGLAVIGKNRQRTLLLGKGIVGILSDRMESIFQFPILIFVVH